MTLPNVSVSKATFSIAQAPASSVGIPAIIAASSTGTANQVGGFARSDLAVTADGYGPLTEYAAYCIAVANQPTVLVKSAASIVGAYGAITKTMTGTSVPTAGASAPFDTYSFVRINVTTGGTIGVAGIVYTYTLDGGNVTSAPQALGTSSTFTIPNTGVSFSLAAGTLVAGDTWQCYTTQPLANDADVLVSLTALSRSRLPWEGVLIDCQAGSGTVGVIDTFLSSLEGKGQFKFAVINSRFKTEPEPTAEDEATYAAALQTTFGNSTSIRACVGADGAHMPSQITGITQKRPTSLALVARAMSIPIGTDPAYVATGAINSAQIADGNGNPYDHDEDLFPTLDSLRLTSLRSFAPGGPQGVYITNANVIQPSGGAFPYLQHVRIANRACEIAWSILTQQLSRGVRKNPKKDPVTGAVYIFEPDAAIIDGLVNDALVQPMRGQVSAIQFTLSRTDDMSAVPCIVTATLQIVALAYIKGYLVTQAFVKQLSTTL